MQNHTTYLNPAVEAWSQSFVFFPGTGGLPAVYDRIDSLATNLGYHSIGLMYPDQPSVGSLCGGSVDANCFENVRREIIDGTNRSTLVSVNRVNSIENRLLKRLTVALPVSAGMLILVRQVGGTRFTRRLIRL